MQICFREFQTVNIKGGELQKAAEALVGENVDLKKYELELSHGDVVVMVSDGVTGEGGECPWLFDLLAQNLPNRGLERTADLIVKYATAKGSDDDITVMIVKVD